MHRKMGYLMFSNSLDHILVNIVGILLAVYALYVELRKNKDPNYVALCDINDKMSCSKVLTSEYSRGFGFVQLLVGKEHFLNAPNCVLGIIFYSLQICLGLVHHPWAQAFLFYSSVVSCIGSCYLAYVLFFILHDICIVCMATYVTNGMLLYLNYMRSHSV